MAIATFHPLGRAADWGSSTTQAEAVARLVMTAVSHALYVKSQLGVPVHALRRAHACKEPASRKSGPGIDRACAHDSPLDPKAKRSTTIGASVARPLVRPGPRTSNHAIRADLLSTLDLLESSLRVALEAGMQACPGEQEVDVVLLFGPGLLFPKQLFCITVLLPALPQMRVSNGLVPKPVLHQDKGQETMVGKGLGPKPIPLKAKAQEPARSEDKLKSMERRLLAFLVEHDTDPAEGDVSLPTNHAEEPLETLSLYHPSCDKIKKRAMKCHVALRAREPFVHASVASQPTQPKPTWVHKPSFHPRGMEQHFASSLPSEPTPALVPPRSVPSIIRRPQPPAVVPDPSICSSPVANGHSAHLSSPGTRAETPPIAAVDTTPLSHSVSMPRSRGEGSMTASPASTSRSISWSGVVAGSGPPRALRRAPSPNTFAPTSSSTPLRPSRHLETTRQRPLISVGSSPPSMTSASVSASVSESVSRSLSGSRVARPILRGAKRGPLCGRMRIDLRRGSPRAAVPIYNDSDSDEDPPPSHPSRPLGDNRRTWAVFTPPIFGGGVGL